MDFQPQLEDQHAKADLPLVVGVDAEGRAASAVVWAAEEANRTGRSLLLVSAIHRDPSAAFRNHNLASLARRLTLADVQHTIHDGRPSQVILAAAESAALTVVGRRGMSLARRSVVGGTSLSVVTAAPCPVVMVPEGWIQPGLCSQPIVLGLTPQDLVEEVHTGARDPQRRVIDFAFERAASMRVPLTVTSAWSIPPSLLRNPAEVADCGNRFTERLGRRLALWRESYPDVELTLDSQAANGLAALLQAESRAQLTVVGRHSGTTPPPLGLGSTTRALVRRAHHPVAVIPI